MIAGLVASLLASAFAMPPTGRDADVAFAEVGLGETHACGRYEDGAVACWGRNDRGQLGDGSTDASTFPRRVVGLDDAIALTVGAFHTCAVKRDRTVVCWGDNQSDQLGATADLAQTTPVAVQGLRPTLAVAAGASHTCAVALDGAVSCWGNNLYGQLGLSDLRKAPRPVPAPDLPAAVGIAAGYGHSCAIGREDGRVYCWGVAERYATGRPPPGDPRPMPPLPIDVPLPPARAVAARGDWTCMLHDDGVHCWGAQPIDTEGKPPALLVKQDNLVQLSVGWGHGCALRLDKTVTCFGDDRFGQLGAVRPARPVVAQAYGVRDAQWVAAGNGASCAARGPSARTVCWGSYTSDEKAAAAKERGALAALEPPTRERLAPQGTEIDLLFSEVLKEGGSQVRLEVRTVESQPCANARLDIVPTLKKRSLRLDIGEPYLPGGDCIAQSAPAVGLVDLPADADGRYDITVVWRKKADFYQMFLREHKMEALPMQVSYSRWVEPRSASRVPDGALAIRCIDRMDAPMCQRHQRDGLLTCDRALADAAFRDVPTLDARRWVNTWFTSDPNATYVQLDTGHERIRAAVERDLVDGSQCVDLSVRTWEGRIWSNRAPQDVAP